MCIEILKGEFDRAHCLENLIFYLYVVRYRKMQSSLIRKMLATHIFNTFIADGSELQINISQRQKENIAAAIQRSGGDATPLSLYDETRKEIMLLIENNVMKSFVDSPGYRTCLLVLSCADLRSATGKNKDAVQAEIEARDV